MLRKGTANFPKAPDFKVYVIKTENRAFGIKKLLENFDLEKT